MINEIDFLSPPITLFHLERRTHTSKVGGIFVIIMTTMCFTYAGYLLYNLLGHKKLVSLFHKKFEYEAGYYSFNPSSIFISSKFIPLKVEDILTNMIRNI